ncbi:antibiotic biosynthesis monooxygenase [Hymenobacter tibetensis]|uniref:Antibiotic biosynthesis monooxygenase n=1 Tax=Hymenobacter tibetensis TaxID=497967 RepID=A0ABY4CTF0_9BACT|nr:antibiotic biosynthesis monooxygenase [Hymenobacter tibetensis]UOG73468.1 antibiotic biosynthesis monooxygenase [Hymenobacter tibetensis]
MRFPHIILKTVLLLVTAAATSNCSLKLPAQSAQVPAQKPQKVRLSRIVVDSTQLESYKAFLQEEIEASMSKEPGVLSLYAVFERKKPNHLTILEMYATEAAYQAHVKTPHFLKYKQGTLGMVQELELIDTDPLIPALKIK